MTIPPTFRTISRSIDGVQYLISSVGILCGDELVCLIHSHVTVLTISIVSAVRFSTPRYLHAKKDLGKLVYILASSIFEKALKRVVCDDELGLFFPHPSKFERGIRFP